MEILKFNEQYRVKNLNDVLVNGITHEQIISIGWKLESSYDIGNTYEWDPTYRNSPTLWVSSKPGGARNIEIRKFLGNNDFAGHMDKVFYGNCEDIAQLDMIMGLVDLDKYYKIRKSSF